MVDEGRSGGSYGDGMAQAWEDRSGVATGTIIATALAAGVVAYLIRRSRQEEPAERMVRIARNFDTGEGLEVGREFFMGKVLPELKPALLAVLEEVEDAVNQGFRRLEKSIKKF